MEKRKTVMENLEQTAGGADPEAGGRQGTCMICGKAFFAFGFELGGREPRIVTTGMRCEACLKQELQQYLQKGDTFVRWLR